ncbi:MULTISPECIES: S53 family peptidase [Kitasatospora]|uniref:S53 family peptidase n=1 Tax=Kitasatospora cystarginea TaxID=58350 RepID=A0ABP5R5G4_9ACTN
MSEQHTLLEGSKRPAKGDATRVRDADAQAPVSVTLSLRGPATGADMDQRRADAEKTKTVLERYGLKVDRTKLEPGSIEVSGPVAAMNAAFQANLGIYHSTEQGEFRGREGAVRIPAELEGIVTGVFGLDQRRVARRAAAPGSGAMGSLTPADLEKRYTFPQGDGQGQKIGIAEFGGGYFADDLHAFCTQHGVETAQVAVVPLGYTPPLSIEELRQLPPQDQLDASEATPEVMMDVQIVAGLCPRATISLYFAPFDQKGWIDLLDQTIQDKPVTLSVSWGLAEDAPDWSQAALTEIDKRLQAAATLGITVCVASGDDGAGDQVADGAFHVDFPAASPSVLSVGGTMINGSGEEQAWWESPGHRTRKGGGASGGGVSILFDRPDWQDVQVRSLNKHSRDGRVVPDVAALAGSPLYDLTLVGRPSPNGGTSASTPLWAALIARINALLPDGKRQRFLTPLLYQHGTNGQRLGQTACQDIKVGHDNGSHPPAVGYPVLAGYDAVTGWGVPVGTALLDALR